MKTTLITVLGGTALAFVSASPVQGVTTFWEFQGTFSAESTDSLGIDGQSFTYTLELDHDGGLWADVGGELYYPVAGATVTMTGPHSIALGSADPAIRIRSANNAVVPVEGVGNASFLDFTIDGTEFVNAAATDPMVPSVVPVDGDAFSVDHLTTAYGVPTIILGPDDVNGDSEDYSITDGSVTITTIPEPTSTALALLGMGGLMVRRRRVA